MISCLSFSSKSEAILNWSLSMSEEWLLRIWTPLLRINSTVKKWKHQKVLNLHESQTRIIYHGIGSEMFSLQYFIPLISMNPGTCLEKHKKIQWKDKDNWDEKIPYLRTCAISLFLESFAHLLQLFSMLPYAFNSENVI